MERPKIKPKLTSIDYLLEAAGALFVIAIISLSIYYYNKLPETIPIHFNASGKADDYGDKSLIWGIVIIETVLYISMLILTRFPHLFNYPKPITKENASDQYRMGARLLRVINFITAAIFCYIIYMVTQTALNNNTGLSGWFMPIILIIIFGSLIIYFYKVFKQKKTSSEKTI